MAKVRDRVQAQSTRGGRRGQQSCDFCRARKLRCDRLVQTPCTNCLSRGKTCHFDPPGVDEPGRVNSSSTALPSAVEGGDSNTHPFQSPAGTNDGTSIATDTACRSSTTEGPGSLLEGIRSLKRLTHELEQRAIREKAQANPPDAYSVTLPTLSGPATPLSLPRYDSPIEARDQDDDGISQLALLERLSVGRHSRNPPIPDTVVFRIVPIRDIPHAPSHVMYLGQHTRCVSLPARQEAMIILHRYLEEIGYIHHIIHHPSLPGLIEKTYAELESPGPTKPGNVILLLAIIAAVTHTWMHNDGDTLFASMAEANSQENLWIKATRDVIHVAQHSSPPSLEAIQGIIILYFVMCHKEGHSPTFRTLLSTALMFCRELGLHRLDHPSNGQIANTFEAEIGRRVWWHAVATDWLLAARDNCSGTYQVHPAQILTNKPSNINDSDLQDGGSNDAQPLSTPTDMSYTLQRIRLAEISRDIVDRTWSNPSASPNSPQLNYADIMAIDIQLANMIAEIPPFFRPEAQDPTVSPPTQLTVQSYMINQLVHLQRCKLHLPYLIPSTSPPNPMHAYSRETCLAAARAVIANEKRLEAACPRFAFLHVRLAGGMLSGIFIASIALCADGGSDAADALGMLEAASRESLAAANLLASLKQAMQRRQGIPTPLSAADNNSAGAAGCGNEVEEICQGVVEAMSTGRMEAVGGQAGDNGGLGCAGDEMLSFESLPWDDILLEFDSSSSLFFC